MSAAQKLRGEIVTTLSLGMARGALVEELAADVLHEMLGAGNEEVEDKAALLITLREHARRQA